MTDTDKPNLIDDEKRYERQKELYNGDTENVLIVGVGAVGRQVALMLASMGCKKLTMVDFDVVDDVNLAAQGFPEKDIGLPKVVSVSKSCKRLNSTIEMHTINNPFEAEHVKDKTAIFCCVDTMTTRKQVMESFVNNGKDIYDDIFLDSRMAAEIAKILCIYNNYTHDRYIKELFTDDEMIEERCTAKTTLYCANICAGMMVSQYVKFTRNNNDIEYSITYNIKQSEFFRG